MNINSIVAYESGELNDAETLQLFADLIKSGEVWWMQGHYGRTATELLDNGYITADGEVTDKHLNIH
jgi:hypothetical protein